MRTESRHWIELENWVKALGVLEGLGAKFSGDPSRKMEMVTYVLPDLAHAYLAQSPPRVAEAHPILAELVASSVKKPSQRTLLDYTRSVTGWVEGTAIEMREVPGAGLDAATFADATDKLNSLANSVDPKWSCEWYALKFQLAYGYYKWASAEGGPQDSRKRDTARRQLNVLIQELGAQFRGTQEVPGMGLECAEDPILGKDILRRRFVWLWGRVK